MSVDQIASPDVGSPVYPLGTDINEAGHLVVGGCDVVEIAREYGTPAYIYAVDDIKQRAAAYVNAFRERGIDFDVLFASKAAPITALYRLLAAEGLSADVASGGELAAALKGGFDPARIYMHGNNKTPAELRQALEAGVGHIVIDNFDEIERLEGIAAEIGPEGGQDVLIRVTPGIKPSTHTYIQTGQVDSKFGFGLENGQAAAAVEAVRRSPHLNLAGLHAHIGSQIFELEPYEKLVEALAGLAGDGIEVLNLGGGLGIAYGAADEPPSIETFVDTEVAAVRRVFGEAGLPIPKILIEPGRSLVGNAGLTVYTIGSVKEIPGVRTYVAVDGGMSDNMRPMLYGSKYEAIIGNRADGVPDTVVTIAGMHCESSDLIVKDVALASPQVGDIVVTPATGAYGHAMASNYNGVARPPVIFCSGGEAKVVVRRETYEDLLARDVD